MKYSNNEKDIRDNNNLFNMMKPLDIRMLEEIINKMSIIENKIDDLNCKIESIKKEG